MWDQTVTCKTVNEIILAISRKFKGGPVRQNIIVKIFIAEVNNSIAKRSCVYYA